MSDDPRPSRSLLPRFAWEQLLREDPDLGVDPNPEKAAARGGRLRALAVAFLMSSFADANGANIRVSIGTLVRMTATSSATVRRGVEDLVARGYLFRDTHGTRAWDGSVAPSVYHLCAPRVLTGEQLDARSSAHRRALEVLPSAHQTSSKCSSSAPRVLTGEHQPGITRNDHRGRAREAAPTTTSKNLDCSHCGGSNWLVNVETGETTGRCDHRSLSSVTRDVTRDVLGAT